MPAKVVLVTSGQPSLNPRLVKEADALCEAGYQVTVIYQFWNDWGTQLDQSLLASKAWTAIRVAGSPTAGKFSYTISRVMQKAAIWLRKITGSESLFAETAICRGAMFLKREAINQKADLYIGHNLGALGPAVLAARYHQKPCSFDAEDYHRNEVSNDPGHADVRIKAFLETKYFPQLSFLTAASPLIGKAYQKLFPNTNPVTLLNVFPGAAIASRPAGSSTQGPLKLFWFSQTVSKNRGLEAVLEAMAQINSQAVELHLLGDLRTQDRQYFETLFNQLGLMAGQIRFYPPIPADEIITFASRFDVGLATETGYPYNRDICLTNKIFTYIQAGLAVLATNTEAQTALLTEYPELGSIYNKADVAQLRSLLLSYISSTSLLQNQQQAALEAARKQLNWEHEKKIFLQLVHTHLKSPD